MELRTRRNIPTARTKRQAEEAERKARQEIQEGTYSTRKPMLFVDFVKTHYLPWAEKHNEPSDTDQTMTDLLCAHFKAHTLAQVSEMAVEGFKLAQAKRITQYGTPYAQATVNLALAHLSGILNMAVCYNLKKSNTCKGLKWLPVPPRRPRYLSPDEEAVLMPALERSPSTWLKDLVQLAVWTGFRQRELIEIRREHVDFAHRLIFVARPKWKKDPRKTEGFPMSASVCDLVTRLCQSDYLFNYGGKPLSKAAVDSAFRKACRGIGVYDLNFHALRHTFGTRLGDRDVNLKKIARLMGHSTTKHTEIYVHTTDAGLSEAVEIATLEAQNRTRTVNRKAAGSL